jgi:hypothetical protein
MVIGVRRHSEQQGLAPRGTIIGEGEAVAWR